MSIVASILLVIGACFILLAALGVWRLPDLYMRMHAASKASTFGLGFILLAVAIRFQSFEVFAKASLLILFVFLTTPLAAHMIGRAAYLNGVPTWKGTRFDEIQDQTQKH